MPARRGAQEPRIRVEPQGVAVTDGPDAARLIGAYGFDLDPWQRLVIDAWAARDASDGPLYTTCGCSVPRQNGKNGIIEAYEFYKMLVCGERILHTAHQVKTANKSFQRLAALLDNPRNREVKAMVANVRRTNGEQGIYLTNGAYVEYSARSRGASRGNTYSMVVYDEAQELTDDQVEALMSTIAASPTGYRQLVYTGTPPGPNSPGTVFPRVRRAALERPGTRTCWHEWSVEEIGDVDDRDRWYETNPAMGIRLDEEFTQTERDTMTPDGFARERLGWWSEQQAACAIKQKAWADAAVSERANDGPGKRAFGVKFAPDGSQIALVACRLPEEGAAYIELIGVVSLDDGMSWLEGFLCDEERADRTACVAVDGKNGADALMDRLKDFYPRQALPRVGTRDVIAAASIFSEDLKAKKVAHWAHETQELLDRSATGCVKRPIGSEGGWGFGGESSAAVEAASLALWAAKTTKRDPDGGCVIL